MNYYEIILKSKDSSTASAIAAIRNEAKQITSKKSELDTDLFQFEDKKPVAPYPSEKKAYSSFFTDRKNSELRKRALCAKPY